jgi:hypothetical protein
MVSDLGQRLDGLKLLGVFAIDRGGSVIGVLRWLAG